MHIIILIMTDRVFITNADYPLTLEIPFTGSQNPRIVPLVKIKETEDPASKEPLEFPTEETWTDVYNRLEKVCVSCCPNGHPISFQTFCRMLRDDDWDITNLPNIVKIKCPMCRTRYLIHETMVTLAYSFNSLQTAIDPEKNSKLEHVNTYFSTLDDEDEEEDVGNLIEFEDESDT